MQANPEDMLDIQSVLYCALVRCDDAGRVVLEGESSEAIPFAIKIGRTNTETSARDRFNTQVGEMGISDHILMFVASVEDRGELYALESRLKKSLKKYQVRLRGKTSDLTEIFEATDDCVQAIYEFFEPLDMFINDEEPHKDLIGAALKWGDEVIPITTKHSVTPRGNRAVDECRKKLGRELTQTEARWARQYDLSDSESISQRDVRAFAETLRDAKNRRSKK